MRVLRGVLPSRGSARRHHTQALRLEVGRVYGIREALASDCFRRVEGISDQRASIAFRLIGLRRAIFPKTFAHLRSNNGFRADLKVSSGSAGCSGSLGQELAVCRFLKTTVFFGASGRQHGRLTAARVAGITV